MLWVAVSDDKRLATGFGGAARLASLAQHRVRLGDPAGPLARPSGGVVSVSAMTNTSPRVRLPAQICITKSRATSGARARGCSPNP